MINNLPEKQIRLSPSRLNLFSDCPYCFWLSMVKGINQPRGPMPTILTGLDSVIKNYFQRYRERGELPPIIRGKIAGKLIARPLSFIKFSDNSINAIMSGKLDECVILEDGSYAPLDHKSRGSFASAVHPAFQMQMDSYTLLLERNNYPVSDKAYLVYYVPSDGELHSGFPFKVDVKEIKTNPSRALDLFRKAVEVARAPSPPPSGGECAFCKWRESLEQ